MQLIIDSYFDIIIYSLLKTEELRNLDRCFLPLSSKFREINCFDESRCAVTGILIAKKLTECQFLLVCEFS